MITDEIISLFQTYFQEIYKHETVFDKAGMQQSRYPTI